MTITIRPTSRAATRLPRKAGRMANRVTVAIPLPLSTRDTLRGTNADIVQPNLLQRPFPHKRSGRFRVTERKHLRVNLVFCPGREHAIEFGNALEHVRSRESKEF
ncbi:MULTISPECIES: hypothetical protein [Gordonibacter]|uniref:Uncharacterized protein n=1 Tax=Gordonibacter urolithinfaciens TaxID=1335613 RepID=A0A7K0I627_9ACTN|nr:MULTISPECIES: hypothetical protein [Gordonibacter]MCB7086172.1 hypothetical protein [Gordonibacter urolithinfaciens]MDN4468877.1 hypothetical protein [Gordonibacter sp. RACS_AR68]MSA93499.1 hypothetical protein [Gordonibacter urolithinfaciens]